MKLANDVIYNNNNNNQKLLLLYKTKSNNIHIFFNKIVLLQEWNLSVQLKSIKQLDQKLVNNKKIKRKKNSRSIVNQSK